MHHIHILTRMSAKSIAHKHCCIRCASPMHRIELNVLWKSPVWNGRCCQWRAAHPDPQHHGNAQPLSSLHTSNACFGASKLWLCKQHEHAFSRTTAIQLVSQMSAALQLETSLASSVPVEWVHRCHVPVRATRARAPGGSFIWPYTSVHLDSDAFSPNLMTPCSKHCGNTGDLLYMYGRLDTITRVWTAQHCRSMDTYRFCHFLVKVIALTCALTNTREHRESTYK